MTNNNAAAGTPDIFSTKPTTKASPWADFTDADFNLKKDKLTGTWCFKDVLIRHERIGATMSVWNGCSGPQNDACFVMGK